MTLKTKVKNKKLKVIKFPYSRTTYIGKWNMLFGLDRAILISEKEEINKFEKMLKFTGKRFKKEKHGDYYRYWVEV